jgi:hypothetical protein
MVSGFPQIAQIDALISQMISWYSGGIDGGQDRSKWGKLRKSVVSYDIKG